jgi:radical SAM superfamily enzyme YgiQ (UPF0313 family)
MKKVDVIFLTGVMTPWFERSIGAYQLSNFIQSHGYTSQVIDFIHLFNKELLLSVLEKFTGENTKMLGISSTFISSEVYVGAQQKSKAGTVPDWIIETFEDYKKKYPHVKIVAGGAKALGYKKFNVIDHIITGYAEIALLKFLDNIYNERLINGDKWLNEFHANQIKHKFNNQDVILPNETLPIEVSRGCIFRCKFCAYPLNGKKKMDHIRDVELIKDELVNNYNKWKITNYLISDDTFNDSNDKLEALHAMITSLPFKINFVCYLRLDLLYHFRDTQLTMLEEMGLKSCHFGVESFNPETAKFIGKGLSEDKTKDFLLYLKDRWKNKISFMCTFISGLPFESKESCIDTGKWCKENDITFWIMPLLINPGHIYKSDIDINYKSYGYTLHEDLSWDSPWMTFNKAKEIANMYVSDPREHKVSAWNMFAILSMGLHSADELYHMSYSDLDKEVYVKEMKEKFKLYVKGLYEL